MRQLLKFLLTNKADSDLCRKLEEKEKKVKMTARAYKEYMDYCMLRQECFDSGKQEGYELGVQDGVEQGIEQGKFDAARNMLAENDSVEKVVRCTGLPLETVRELAEQLQVAAK